MSEFEQFISTAEGYEFPIGIDSQNKVIKDNLTEVNHLLVSGISGSGKTAFIDALLLSFMCLVPHDELRFILCDTKGSDYNIYNNTSHLFVPAVTDNKRIAGALQWSVVECLRRLRVFSEQGVRNLPSYNKRLKESNQELLPRILVVVDDLTAAIQYNPECIECVQRILSVGRSAGFHLIAVTQTPAIKEIRSISSAFPSKLILQPSSAAEYRFLTSSRTIPPFDEPGKAVYCHGAIQAKVTITTPTDEEMGTILNAKKDILSVQYSKSLQDKLDQTTIFSARNNYIDENTGYDELLPQAVDVIFETKQASVSMLQRRLKLGYSRAARLIDQLEEVGVVGPYEGSAPRKIVITKQQWNQMQAMTQDTIVAADELSELPDVESEPLPSTYTNDHIASEDTIISQATVSSENDYTRNGPRCPTCGSYELETKESSLFYRVFAKGSRHVYRCTQCGKKLTARRKAE